MSEQSLTISGIYEFVVSVSRERGDQALRYWAQLGFTSVSKGRLDAGSAAQLYGHRSPLTSYRLEHPGGKQFNSGHVRLMVWDELRNAGLAEAKPLDVGARWMGIYTRDILQLRDAYVDSISYEGMNWHVTEIVRAPLADPPPPCGFLERFVGLREMFVIGPEIRHAFIQRSGFDRPGFGTFTETTPMPNTQGTHANIVQPVGSFATDFYRRVFDLVTAPYGEASDAGAKESTKIVLSLAPGQTFRVERLMTPDVPTGMLQVYAPYNFSQDARDRSRPGSRGLCLYTYQVRDLNELRNRAAANGACNISPIIENEFGERSCCFDAPDGNVWGAVEYAS